VEHFTVKRSNRLIIVVGVFLAVAGGLMTVYTLGSGSASPTPSASVAPSQESTTPVVIAKQDISLGDTITAAMVDTKQMTVSQAAALGSDAFSNVGQVIGKIAGHNITSGQVLLGSRDFTSAGTWTVGQDLAGSIATGMVAVDMLVDQINGVGTLIVPGDHVDIILSVYVTELNLTAKDPNGTVIDVKGGSDVTTKTVIQNCKVLATLLTPAGGAAAATPVAGSSSQPAAPTAPALIQNDNRTMIVVVEVTPADAEVLRWAQRAEKTDPQTYIDLSLALRSSKADSLPNVTTPGITFKMLVDKYGVLPVDPRAILPPDLTKGISW
jgi:Flp pilus assembly protein CpaB